MDPKFSSRRAEIFWIQIIDPKIQIMDPKFWERLSVSVRSRALNIGPDSAPLFSSRIKETLIGQKSIKVGLLELKLRMCLSLSPFILGWRAHGLFD